MKNTEGGRLLWLTRNPLELDGSPRLLSALALRPFSMRRPLHHAPGRGRSFIQKQKTPRSARRDFLAKNGVKPLEREFGRQLNPPWPATTQERVSYAHVARGGDGISRLAHFSVPAGFKSVESWIGNECRQKRIRKVWVVQHIEEFGADLHLHPLGDRCVLIDRHVPLFECRAVEGVTAQIPEVPRARDAIGSKARRCRLRHRCEPDSQRNRIKSALKQPGPRMILK